MNTSMILAVINTTLKAAVKFKPEEKSSLNGIQVFFVCYLFSTSVIDS